MALRLCGVEFAVFGVIFAHSGGLLGVSGAHIQRIK
jgi:hypothetical protein